MIKVYCDACGGEIPAKQASEKFRRLQGRLGVEIFATIDGIFEGGHVCRACLLRVANDGEDVRLFPRPTVVKE